MYKQFIDEESNEKQVQLLMSLGFPEPKARKAVQKYPNTTNLEDLVNRALEMSDENSKHSFQNMNRISLIQFSEDSSIQNPLSDENFNQCQVCFTILGNWLNFECQHQFCQQCVEKSIQFKRCKNQDQITCLQEGCHERITNQDFPKVAHLLNKSVDIEPYNGPICQKCRLPTAMHKFSLFSNACDSVEFTILSACIKHDEQGNILQRCPTCSIWVQKMQGCNSVSCSYCKTVWCWLCRRQCDANHYRQFNPLGCPGLGAEEFTIDQWPWHKICCKRVKALLLYFLLYVLCVIVYPFFVGYVMIRRLNFNLEGQCIEKTFKYLFIAFLFLLISTLAIFPGIIIFLISTKARQMVFGM